MIRAYCCLLAKMYVHFIRIYPMLPSTGQKIVCGRLPNNDIFVYIESNNIQVEIIRFRKKIATLLTFETLKWKYTLYFRDQCAHCYP